MTMHWKLLKSVNARVAPWLRVLSDGCGLVFNSLPHLGDAGGADNLPVSFIVKRDSGRPKAGNGKRHYPMPGHVAKGIDLAPGVRVAQHRADARSTLRRHGERGNLGRRRVPV